MLSKWHHLKPDAIRMRLTGESKLNLPLQNLTYSHTDKKTIGSPTYSSYQGVCYSDAARLQYRENYYILQRNIVR